MQTQPQSQPSGQTPWTPDFAMTCTSSATGNQYETSLSAANGGQMLTAGKATYKVAEWHWTTKTPQALVVTGNTKYGTYAAVFKGPNPRMVFNEGKKQVVDQCGY
jgi:hypothetical protein